MSIKNEQKLILKLSPTTKDFQRKVKSYIKPKTSRTKAKYQFKLERNINHYQCENQVEIKLDYRVKLK